MCDWCKMTENACWQMRKISFIVYYIAVNVPKQQESSYIGTKAPLTGILIITTVLS